MTESPRVYRRRHHLTGFPEADYSNQFGIGVAKNSSSGIP